MGLLRGGWLDNVARFTFDITDAPPKFNKATKIDLKISKLFGIVISHQIFMNINYIFSNN